MRIKLGFVVSLYVGVLISICLCQHYEEPGSDSYVHAAALKALRDIENVQNSWLPDSYICYDHLGCFYRNGTFSHIKMLPDSPEIIDTRFVLFTRRNKLFPQYLDYVGNIDVHKTYFDPNKPVKIISHGFGGNGTLAWMMKMKNAFLYTEDVNVILVDWSSGARVSNYIMATVNTEVVGRQIAVLMLKLRNDTGLSLRNVHVVGFSLGAGVVGFVGKWLRHLKEPLPGRITGLDPASPLFEFKGVEIHLTKEDGELVDVIHTNADTIMKGGVGIERPLGHRDFYPNGGKRQPGCSSTISSLITDVFTGDRDRACNHERAVHLFIETILRGQNDCKYLAYTCPNGHDDFMKPDCLSCKDGPCGIMGYHSKGTGSFYLATADRSPYCRKNLHVSMEIAKDQKGSYGHLDLALMHPLGEDVFKITDDATKLTPGETVSVIATIPQAIETPDFAAATYYKYSGWISSGTDTIDISDMMVKDFEEGFVFHNCSRVTLAHEVTSYVMNGC